MSIYRPANDPDRRAAVTAAVSVPSVCPACQSSSISTSARVPDTNSYWRCASCGEVWNAGRRVALRGGGHPWR